jgi:hypothetical protein
LFATIAGKARNKGARWIKKDRAKREAGLRTSETEVVVLIRRYSGEESMNEGT